MKDERTVAALILHELEIVMGTPVGEMEHNERLINAVASLLVDSGVLADIKKEEREVGRLEGVDQCIEACRDQE